MAHELQAKESQGWQSSVRTEASLLPRLAGMPSARSSAVLARIDGATTSRAKLSADHDARPRIGLHVGGNLEQ